MTDSTLLKKDLFGEIRFQSSQGRRMVVRDCTAAAPGLRWLARSLMRREARALDALQALDGIARVVALDRHRLVRSFVDGQPLHRARPCSPDYFRSAAILLRQMHRAGVAHNDLGKEPNLLMRTNGSAAFIDFQLAMVSPRRSRLFRLAAREDLRHLLKHKRSYCPATLTQREKHILANPGGFSKAWARTVKPVYLFVTRRILRWADREGAGDRGERH